MSDAATSANADKRELRSCEPAASHQEKHMSSRLPFRPAGSLGVGVSLALLVSLALGACSETLTAPPLVTVLDDSTVLRPHDPGRFCVDYVNDDTNEICIVAQGSNGLPFTKDEHEPTCFCPVSAIR
jgi:hypothetical protein